MEGCVVRFDEDNCAGIQYVGCCGSKFLALPILSPVAGFGPGIQYVGCCASIFLALATLAPVVGFGPGIQYVGCCASIFLALATLGPVTGVGSFGMMVFVMLVYCIIFELSVICSVFISQN